MLHPADTATVNNPRVQCAVCGRWSRLHLKSGEQFMYGGCAKTNGDHNAAGDDIDVCEKCCREKCR